MKRNVKILKFSTEFLRNSNGLTPQLMMAMFEVLPADFSIIGWGTDYEKD